MNPVYKYFFFLFLLVSTSALAGDSIGSFIPLKGKVMLSAGGFGFKRSYTAEPVHYGVADAHEKRYGHCELAIGYWFGQRAAVGFMVEPGRKASTITEMVRCPDPLPGKELRETSNAVRSLRMGPYINAYGFFNKRLYFSFRASLTLLMENTRENIRHEAVCGGYHITRFHDSTAADFEFISPGIGYFFTPRLGAMFSAGSVAFTFNKIEKWQTRLLLDPSIMNISFSYYAGKGK
jgi:hypothetical protein